MIITYRFAIQSLPVLLFMHIWSDLIQRKRLCLLWIKSLLFVWNLNSILCSCAFLSSVRYVIWVCMWLIHQVFELKGQIILVLSLVLSNALCCHGLLQNSRTYLPCPLFYYFKYLYIYIKIYIFALSIIKLF